MIINYSTKCCLKLKGFEEIKQGYEYVYGFY